MRTHIILIIRRSLPCYGLIRSGSASGGRYHHDDSKNSENKKHVPTVAEQIDMLYSAEPPIPEYHPRENEPVEQIRSRLLYQSRKRGMLENGLLLSAFADRFLHHFSTQQLRTYDTLINLPSNDWEIYYWIVGTKPVPPEFQSDVMTMLQQFARNEKQESRTRQPDLRRDSRQ